MEENKQVVKGLVGRTRCTIVHTVGILEGEEGRKGGENVVGNSGR